MLVTSTPIRRSGSRISACSTISPSLIREPAAAGDLSRAARPQTRSPRREERAAPAWHASVFRLRRMFVDSFNCSSITHTVVDDGNRMARVQKEDTRRYVLPLTHPAIAKNFFLYEAAAEHVRSRLVIEQCGARPTFASRTRGGSCPRFFLSSHRPRPSGTIL